MMRFIVVILVVLLASSVAAQQTASRFTFMKLMDVQELWERDQYPEAIKLLEDLAVATKDKPYDFALTNQYLAHTAVMMGDSARARPALEAALSVPGLPDELLGEIKMFYAQIVIGDEEYELAKQMFDEWLAVTDKEPSPAQLFSVGYANYMSGHLQESREFISRAIAELPVQTPDDWLRLYYHILFDSKDFTAARQVAIDLLNRNPSNEQYWRLFAGHHMRIEDYAGALAVSEVAAHTGAMQTESDMHRVVSLYSQVLAPERAARKLALWMEEGKVEPDAETWRLQGDLWMLARERENAKAALWKSVQLEPDADVLEFIAGIHFEDAEWDRSFEAFSKALSLTDSEDEDIHRLEMLAGLTAMRAGNRREAREFLMLAEKDEGLRDQVRSILRELEES